jgi:hypothetical protein
MYVYIYIYISSYVMQNCNSVKTTAYSLDSIHSLFGTYDWGRVKNCILWGLLDKVVVHHCRKVLEPTQPPIQWYQGLFPWR